MTDAEIAAHFIWNGMLVRLNSNAEHLETLDCARCGITTIQHGAESYTYLRKNQTVGMIELCRSCHNGHDAYLASLQM